jgi:DNA polymerase/3'-5' exonuclease PolX
MDKERVAEILVEIGTLLELKGENPFKTRAYQNGARIIEGLNEPLQKLVAEERLGELKGIGDALQQKITELVTTGKLKYYDDLKASVPAGLVAMLDISGLGPKKIIALNVPLTPDDATKFWPVYDQYAMAMSKHYDAFYGIIKEYAANQKTLTDAQAIDMLKRWSAVQVELAQTRQKHIGIIEKVIPGRKAAHFFQIDRRLYGLMDLQIASEVPLVLQ